MEKFLIVVVILSIVFFFAFLPTFLILLRAKNLGLKMTFHEAYSITRISISKKDFLKSVKSFKDNGFNMTIVELTSHIWAGGNLNNCLNGLLYAKENGLNIDYRIVTAIDLAGRNVRDSLLDSNKVYHVKQESLENEKILIEFSVDYKYKFPSVFIEKDEEKVKSKITEKLRRFLESWTQDNPLETEQMIRNNILNLDFWEGNLGIILLKQDFIIRQK